MSLLVLYSGESFDDAEIITASSDPIVITACSEIIKAAIGNHLEFVDEQEGLFRSMFDREAVV